MNAPHIYVVWHHLQPAFTLSDHPGFGTSFIVQIWRVFGHTVVHMPFLPDFEVEVLGYLQLP